MQGAEEEEEEEVEEIAAPAPAPRYDPGKSTRSVDPTFQKNAEERCAAHKSSLMNVCSPLCGKTYNPKSACRRGDAGAAQQQYCCILSIFELWALPELPRSHCLR